MSDISKEQYELAISAREDGGTKKKQCEILGIKYNTKRLDKLLEEFEHREVISKRIRAEKRRTAVTSTEAANVITDYLNGMSWDDLSETHYRSVNMMKYIIEKHGATLRTNGRIDRLNPSLLPDECVSEEFEIGQKVWLSQYGCIGEVMKKVNDNSYRVYVLGDGIQQQCYQHVWEMGSLRHLEDLGVNPNNFVSYTRGDEAKVKIYEAWKKAAKRDKER